MDIQTNKRTVARYLALFGRADVTAVLDMMTEDATWWLNGRSDLYPGAGSRTKPEMAKAWRDLYGLLEGGLQMDALSITAEGDVVAAEVRSRATTKKGKSYDNGYHFLFVLRGDKIAAVREYTDLLHAAEVFA